MSDNTKTRDVVMLSFLFSSTSRETNNTNDSLPASVGRSSSRVKARLLGRFSTSENSLRNVFYDQAQRHMSELSVKFDIA